MPFLFSSLILNFIFFVYSKVFVKNNNYLRFLFSICLNEIFIFICRSPGTGLAIVAKLA